LSHQGYHVPGFWAPALQEAQQRCALGDAWAVGDVAQCALLAARVATRSSPSKVQEPKAGRELSKPTSVQNVLSYDFC